MTKILFICYGNICRSPTAEFVMKDLVNKAGLKGDFEIASAATSDEELGNGVYAPSRRLLAAHGIDCAGKTARQINRGDYRHYDLIIGMDAQNMRYLRRYYDGDPESRIKNLLDYTGTVGEEIADPWYTRDFERAWDEIYAGCTALLGTLTGAKLIDFSRCRSRDELYAELARKLAWESWYGHNLDALWDVLTGMPLGAGRYIIIPPDNGADEELCKYASRIKALFCSAKRLYEGDTAQN